MSFFDGIPSQRKKEEVAGWYLEQEGSKYIEALLKRAIEVDADPDLDNYVFMRIDGYDHSSTADDFHDAWYENPIRFASMGEFVVYRLGNNGYGAVSVICDFLIDYIVEMFEKNGFAVNVEGDDEREIFINWTPEIIEEVLEKW